MFTIGADPELFIQKGTDFISAHNLVPGSKKFPHKIDGGALQPDGLAAEFNIDPASTEEEFVSNIMKTLKSLEETIQKDDRTLSLVPLPVATFSADYFKGLPEGAKVLGCDPDFSAYFDGEQRPVEDITNSPWRPGGGHIHIGWTDGADIGDPEHLELCKNVVKQLDIALFLPSRFWDRDEQRMKAYGLPGSFRPKSYGVEYRVLSNAWLKEEALVRWVYAQTQWALGLLLKDVKLYEEYALDALSPYEALEICSEYGAPAFPWAELDFTDIPADFWDCSTVRGLEKIRAEYGV